MVSAILCLPQLLHPTHLSVHRANQFSRVSGKNMSLYPLPSYITSASSSLFLIPTLPPYTTNMLKSFLLMYTHPSPRFPQFISPITVFLPLSLSLILQLNLFIILVWCHLHHFPFISLFGNISDSVKFTLEKVTSEFNIS